MDCQLNLNLKNCPCTYPGCSRKGKCCDCLVYHLKSDELPACCFSPEAEKSFDRSTANFVRIYQEKNEGG